MTRLILIAMLGAASAYGQSVSQVTDALATIQAHDALLGAAYENIQGMSTGQEATVLASASDAINGMRLMDGTVIAVANLVRRMRDPGDLKDALAQLQYSLGYALRVAEVSLKSMNGYLTLIKAPAAAAEVTKARDQMIAIREALRSLKNDSATPPPSQ